MKSATIAILAAGSVAAAATGIVVATHQTSNGDRASDTAIDLGEISPTIANTTMPNTPSSNDSTLSSDGATDNATDSATPMPSTPLAQQTPVNDLFSSAISEMRSRTQVPILVPNTLPASVTDDTIHVHSEGDARYYIVVMGLTPDCTANACSVGSIEGELGGAPYADEFSETVELAQNIQGYFQPTTCGASCSPPVMGWQYNGAFYRLYFKLPGSDAEVRDGLVAIANSAIDAGPR